MYYDINIPLKCTVSGILFFKHSLSKITFNILLVSSFSIFVVHIIVKLSVVIARQWIKRVIFKACYYIVR